MSSRVETSTPANTPHPIGPYNHIAKVDQFISIGGTAVAAPNGNFAAFCGMFYEPTSRFAYVEPVATDPTYRRMGLGTAAVLEGIRRCGTLGATVAYVGSDLEFYKELGFKVVYNSECWVKYFS